MPQSRRLRLASALEDLQKAKEKKSLPAAAAALADADAVLDDADAFYAELLAEAADKHLDENKLVAEAAELFEEAAEAAYNFRPEYVWPPETTPLPPRRRSTTVWPPGLSLEEKWKIIEDKID